MDGTFIFLPTTIGPRKLSTNPTKTTDQAKGRWQMPVPMTKRKTIAGIDIKAVPKVGMSDITAATTPHNAPFGTLKQNPNPNRAPCTRAIKANP